LKIQAFALDLSYLTFIEAELGRHQLSRLGYRGVAILGVNQNQENLFAAGLRELPAGFTLGHAILLFL